MAGQYIGTTMRRETIAGLTVNIAGGSDREGGGDGPLVILLHGFGAPGDDLVPLFRQLDVPGDVRFAFPAAPLDLRTLGGGYAGGRAWWMIDVAALDAAMRGGARADRSAQVPDGLVEARSAITEVIAELETRLGARREKTILGGFSQGAMLSLDVALRAERGFAGLVLMSGTILAWHEWEPLLPKLSSVPVLQAHGRSDPLLPFSTAERLRDALRAAGADVRWVQFAGGHTITGSVLEELSRLVRDVAAAP
jgi:phospholipase/carboxylesterase